MKMKSFHYPQNFTLIIDVKFIFQCYQKSYNELKDKHEKEKNATTVAKRNRLNQPKQAAEEAVKSLRNLSSIRVEDVADKKRNYTNYRIVQKNKDE